MSVLYELPSIRCDLGQNSSLRVRICRSAENTANFQAKASQAALSLWFWQGGYSNVSSADTHLSLGTMDLKTHPGSLWLTLTQGAAHAMVYTL